MGTFSIWHWLIVLVIVLLVFGTKKLRNLGGDLGGAIRNFKSSMKEEEEKGKSDASTEDQKKIDTSGRVIDTDGQVIPGLHAAGELVGGLFYFNYPGGTGLMAGSVFGKIAGATAGRRSAQMP